MGAIIDYKEKQMLLPKIKSDFGKVSQREMARKFRIGKTTVNRWCKESGLLYKKYTVNEKFFDRLNEDSAYTLGYIFTDGNVSWNPKKSYWALTITASEKDKDHLEKIRKLISNTKPLLYSKDTKSYRLNISNKVLCKKLMRLGVVPKKSLIIKFPNLPKKHLRHFIRGIVDGDGSVRYVNRKRSPYFEIRIFSGSPKFLKNLTGQIRKKLKITSKVRKVHGNTYSVRYTCSKAKKIADWIYKDANLFLNRKFQRYKVMKKMEVLRPA